MWNYRRVPMGRLIDKLGLTKYGAYNAPLDEQECVPKEVWVPLKQHTGVPSQPMVKKGDRVKRGDLIAAVPEGKLGANVHASVGGKVAEVNARQIRIRTE